MLHLVNWYPNVLASGDAPFVARHVEALRPFVEHQEVWHIECRRGNGWRWVSRSLRADRTTLLVSPLRRWRLIETIGTLLVVAAWTRWKGKGRFDLVDLHIAYPLGAGMRFLKRLFKVPVVVTEHWSAYHYSFRSTSSGLGRIRRIFHHGAPLICVSRSLAEDIRTFAGASHLEVHVVDNVVDTAVHRPLKSGAPEEGRFLAVGLRWPKRLDILLEALAAMRRNGRPAVLRIAGAGPEAVELAERVATLGLQAHVDFLGQLSAEDLAGEMRAAHALLHASEYETYSVVCAEALCCGTPVIASAVGGIPEVVDDAMGWLVPGNTVGQWVAAWERAWDPALAMDRAGISARMSARVAPDTVGKRYHEVLRSILARTDA